jgi:autotransporter-associated beta strand protein
MKISSGAAKWYYLCLSAFNLLLFAAVMLVNAPAQAAIYNWSGASSTNWLDTANWKSGNMAPTGGTYNVVIYVTNKNNNALYYTANQGTTIFTNTTAEGSGRALRIGDQAGGALYITGGTLESRGAAGDILANGTLGEAALVVDGGVFIHTNQTMLFAYAGIGATLTVNSGTAMVASVQTSNATNGYINVNGGLLSLRQLTLTGKAQLTVNLAGGTLQAAQTTGSWLVSTSATYNINGPVVFDTQAFGVTNLAVLSGGGSITKIGSGTLALTANNTLGSLTNSEGTLLLKGSNSISGGVTLNAGTLQLNHNDALGTGAFTINGGVIDSQTGMTNSNNNALNWNKDFTYTGTRAVVLGSGLVTLGSNLTLTASANTLTVDGTITGYVGGTSLNAFDITKAGNGTLTLSQPITLRADQTNAVLGGTINYNGSIGDGGGNYRLTVQGGGTAALSVGNTFGGGVSLLSSTLQISSDASLGAVPVSASPTNLIINGGVLVGPASDMPLNSKRGVAVGSNGVTFSTPAGGVLRITGIINDLAGEAGFVTVASGGSSSTVLSGNNTYSGGTLVPSGGNLLVIGNSALGSGTLTLTGGLLRAAQSAAGTSYISNNVIIAADSTLGGSNAKNLTFLGTVTLSGGTRTLTSSGTDSATFNGVIGDGGNGYGLTKAGNSTFTLANVNTYSGGTFIRGGVLAITTNQALGTGPVTLSNGTLRATGSSGWALSNTLQVATASSNFFDASSDLILTNGANLSGGGWVAKTGASSLQLWGDNSGFSGTFVNSNATTWFNHEAAGSSSGDWVLVSGALAFNNNTGGADKTIQFGSLAGAGGTTLRAGGNQVGSTTFAVGALGTSAQFDGQITDSVDPNSKAAINKVGAGIWTLTGNNSYNGGTTLSGGTLALSGAGTLGSNFISVASGATLDASALGSGFTLLAGQNLTNRGTVAGGLILGSGALVTGGGSFAGAVTNLSGGTLTPGTGGDTNFFQSLTLAGGSTNLFWIGSATTHDMSVITNSLDYTGSGMPQLKLDLSGYTWNSGDTFQLYNNLFTGLSAFDGTNRYFQITDAFGAVSNLYNNALFSAVTGGGTATNLFALRYDFNSGDSQNNDILLTAIPEPASFNLLLMLGAAYWLRRRLHGSRHRWNG